MIILFSILFFSFFSTLSLLSQAEQIDYYNSNDTDFSSHLGDGSSLRLELNDKINFTEISLSSAHISKAENIVKHRTSDDTVSSMLYIPFTTLKSMDHHIVNRIPRNWFFESLLSSNITFLLILHQKKSNSYFPSISTAIATPAATSLNDEDKNKLDAIKAKLKDILGFESNQISFTVCSVPAVVGNPQHWYMVLLALIYCMDNDNSGPFAVIAQNMYTEPYDLKSVMDSIIVSPYNPILVMENSAIVTSGLIWDQYLTNLFKSYSVDEVTSTISNKGRVGDTLLNILSEYNPSLFTVTPLGQAQHYFVLQPNRDEELIFGDYTSYPEALHLMKLYQRFDTKDKLVSCSVPSVQEFSFHHILTSSFKACSFVGNIRRDYEYHAIRYLQRIGRGKGHEVDWRNPQLNDGKKCEVAFGVTSRVTSIWERMLIRQTWGSLARSIGTTRVYFLYGQPNINISDTTRKQLELERAYFKDIVVLPTDEGYFQMFNKVAAWFGWAAQNTTCDIVIKIDPDTYPRIFPLMKFFYQREILPVERPLFKNNVPYSGVYFGMAYYDAPVLNDPNHRWHFYDKYPHDTIPVFMSGALFGITRNLAQYIYDHREPDMRLDDPGVGVILHELKQKHQASFRYESPFEWKIRKSDMGCARDRYFDNPVFSSKFNMTKHFNYDLFGPTFCKYLRNIWVPLADIGSVDGMFKITVNRVDGKNSQTEKRQGKKRFRIQGNSAPSSFTFKGYPRIYITNPPKGYYLVLITLPWIVIFIIAAIFIMRRNRMEKRFKYASHRAQY